MKGKEDELMTVKFVPASDSVKRDLALLIAKRVAENICKKEKMA